MILFLFNQKINYLKMVIFTTITTNSSSVKSFCEEKRQQYFENCDKKRKNIVSKNRKIDDNNDNIYNTSFHHIFMNDIADYRSCNGLFDFFENNNIDVYKYIQIMQAPEHPIIDYFNHQLSQGDEHSIMVAYNSYLYKLFNAMFIPIRERRILIAHMIFTLMLYCGYPIMSEYSRLRDTIYEKINSEEFRDAMNSERYMKCFENHQQYNLMKYNVYGNLY